MSANDFKCMLLIPQDQYEGLKNADTAGGGNTAESGIGGDVRDSNVNNIDVSQGGTLVINDGDTTPGSRHCPSEDGIWRKDSSLAKDRICHSSKVLIPHSTTHTSVPIVVGSPPPPQTQGAQLPADSPLASPQPQPQDTRRKTKKSIGKRGSATAPSSSPTLPRKSSELLKNLVKKRVASLTGKPLHPPKRRKKAMSEGDLNRAVVHDLRLASKAQESPKALRPTLEERKLDRYRAQVA